MRGPCQLSPDPRASWRIEQRALDRQAHATWGVLMGTWVLGGAMVFECSSTT